MSDEDTNNSPVINRDLTEGEFPVRDNESLRDREMSDNEWDSLNVKQKLFDKKVKTWLRIATFFGSSIVLIFLMVIIGWKVFVSFSDVVVIYWITGKTDILWFYGISLCSLIVFMTMVLAMMHVFTFKKKRTKDNNDLNPFTKAVEQLSGALSQILEKLTTRN